MPLMQKHGSNEGAFGILCEGRGESVFGAVLRMLPSGEKL